MDDLNPYRAPENNAHDDRHDRLSWHAANLRSTGLVLGLSGGMALAFGLTELSRLPDFAQRGVVPLIILTVYGGIGGVSGLGLLSLKRRCWSWAVLASVLGLVIYPPFGLVLHGFLAAVLLLQRTRDALAAEGTDPAQATEARLGALPILVFVAIVLAAFATQMW